MVQLFSNLTISKHEHRKRPSENSNKNLIIPLVIFVVVSIVAFLVTSYIIG